MNNFSELDSNYYNPYNNIYDNQSYNNYPHKHHNKFIQSLILFFTHYFDFQSKSSRSHFWYIKLWELIEYIIITLLFFPIFSLSHVSTKALSSANSQQLGMMGKEFGLMYFKSSFLPILMIALMMMSVSSIEIPVLYYCGMAGIIVFVIHVLLCIPLLSLRTRRFRDAGLPLTVALGINIVRVILFLIPSSITVLLMQILIFVSFIIELIPSKNQQKRLINNNREYNTLIHN